MTTMSKVKTKDGHFAGIIKGDIYYKYVIGSKHKLRSPEAWCFDADLIDRYIRPAGIAEICVIDHEAHKEYRVSMGTFLKEKGELERGRGRQYFLIMRWWRVSG